MRLIDRLLIWAAEEDIQIVGNPKSRAINGFSINTQTLQPDEIFIALQGTKQDGHDFVEEALSKGAGGAMVSRAWFASHPHLGASHFMVVVDDPLAGLQSLAKWDRRAFNGPVIGITGSNGKTTTKEMLVKILQRRGSVLKTEGNLNNHIGLPLSILGLKKEDTVAVLEMGVSRPGDMRLLCEIAKPTVGIITNIGPAHLEHLGSVEGAAPLAGVASEKGVLFETIASNGIAIINQDDPYLSKWSQTVSQKWTYSVEGDADVTASEIEQRGNGISFTLTLNRNHSGGGGKMKVILSLVGNHQVYNALAAATAALALGYEFDEIRSALREVRPAPLRGELIEWGGATILLDAYNANPASMKVGIQTLAEYGGGEHARKVAILGDMLELGDAAKALHKEIGKKVAEHRIDRLIAVGKFSEVVACGAAGAGMSKTAISTYKYIESIDLENEIQKGDVVLIKGSRGMQMERLLTLPKETFTLCAKGASR